MAGLQRPAAGDVLYDGESLWGGSEADRERLKHRFGILFQGAVLISEMTLLENVAVKLRLNTALSDREADEVAALKLAIMGLRGYEQRYPSQVSEGIRIRAALARATSLDPDILFFDDPSALLDPLNSRRVDDIILGLRDATGATIVLVSHDLPSIFALADDALFLDAEKKTMIAGDVPQTAATARTGQAFPWAGGVSGSRGPASVVRDRRRLLLGPDGDQLGRALPPCAVWWCSFPAPRRGSRKARRSRCAASRSAR
jgi:phospholipid/cholesterol/gamma-HCH transport system ATP-binding protein